MKRLIVGLAMVFGFALPSVAATYYVDAQYGADGNSGVSPSLAKKTIGTAVIGVSDGDQVIVRAGTYAENVTISKRITLWAIGGPTNTIIHAKSGTAALRVLEGAKDSIVRGFSITGGTGNPGASAYGYDYYGGGVSTGVPINIRDCIIYSNGQGEPKVDAGTFGGGICGPVNAENCLLYENFAWACGGAMFVEGNTMSLNQCTLYNNDSTDFFGYQGGVGLANNGGAEIKNCILWGNGGYQLGAYYPTYHVGTHATISYTCIQGGNAWGIPTVNVGVGNTMSDPSFVDSAKYNFELNSDSPCRGTGENGVDMGFSMNRAAVTHPGINDIAAHQRYPWNDCVDITFTLTGEDGVLYPVEFSVHDLSRGKELIMKTTVPSLLDFCPGTHRVLWHVGEDLPDGFTSDRVTITAKVK